MDENKLLLGDAYKLIKDIPDRSVDLIITDPPYDIKGIHQGGGITKNKGVNFHKELNEKGLDKGIDLSILSEFCRVMKYINIYIFCNKTQLYDYLNFFVKERCCSFDMLIMEKEDPIPFCGTHYLVDKEYCLYFWETGAALHVPFDRGRTVFRFKKNVADKKDYLHPTIKPYHMVETLVLNSSKEGDLILDPFAGSGTSCLAAKRNNRRYIGFEIDEEFYKIASDRLSGFNIRGEMNLFDIEEN